MTSVQYIASLEQVVLADFMLEGRFTRRIWRMLYAMRHIRRMLYAMRQATIVTVAKHELHERSTSSSRKMSSCSKPIVPPRINPHCIAFTEISPQFIEVYAIINTNYWHIC